MTANPDYKYKHPSEIAAPGYETGDVNYSLDSFFVESPAGIGLFDLDCRNVHLNKTLADLLGVGIEQALHRKVSEFLPQPMANLFENQLRKVIVTGTPRINANYSCISLDRPDLIRHWQASIFPVFNKLGINTGVGIQVVETTKLRQTQDEMALQEVFHRTLLENIPARIFMKDCAGNYLYCNRALASDAGFSQDHIIGKNDYDLFPDDLAERYRQEDLEVITSGQIQKFDYEFEKNGCDHHIHVIKAPVVDNDGKMQGVIGLLQDHTDNKRTERQLRIADQALASTLAAVAMANLEGQITYVNPSFVKMWGYENEIEIIGRPNSEFCSNLSNASKALNELRTMGRWLGEIIGHKKDGSSFEALLAGNTVKDEKGQAICLLFSFIDITALKETELKLQENEKKYRQIIDHIDDAAWIYDTANKKILYANPAYEAILGRPRDSLYQNSEDWLKAVHPEDWQHMLDKSKEIGAVKKELFRVIHPDGRVHYIYARITPVVDEKGLVYREVGIAQDVTEARRAETKIRNLSRRLLKVAEDERKTIAMDLHDEFGQVLINLRRCHKDILDHSSEASPITDCVNELDVLIKRMGEIICATIHHLRPDILDKLGLVSALKATVSDFEKHWPNTNVSFKVRGNAGPIDPDHALVLYRVLQEGLTNVTKHAMAENIEIQLVFSFPSVILIIKDDGCGFATGKCSEDEICRRSLGLRGIFERVSAINGQAWITSKPGNGTTLRVEIVNTPNHTEAK